MQKLQMSSSKLFGNTIQKTNQAIFYTYTLVQNFLEMRKDLVELRTRLYDFEQLTKKNPKHGETHLDIPLKNGTDRSVR